MMATYKQLHMDHAVVVISRIDKTHQQLFLAQASIKINRLSTATIKKRTKLSISATIQYQTQRHHLFRHAWHRFWKQEKLIRRRSHLHYLQDPGFPDRLAILVIKWHPNM